MASGSNGKVPHLIIRGDTEAKEAKVIQEEDRVIFVIDGKATYMPWEVAISLGRALIGQGRLAEEHQKAEQIIDDNAILLRSGFPVGLSNNKDIIDETIKEAVSNPELRRFIPGGVRSKSIAHPPTVIMEPKE